MKNAILCLTVGALVTACSSATSSAPEEPQKVLDAGTAVEATNLTAHFSPDHSLEAQIVKGTISARGARPYQAHLSIGTSEGNFSCGGSVIDSKWILTAAHCLSGNVRSVKVRVGVNNLASSQGTRVVASNIYLHPKYRSASGGYDIALVKLRNPLSFNQYVQPIGLPSDTIESVLDQPNKTAIVSGWGDTYSGANQGSRLLREVEIPITPNPTSCGNVRLPGNVICGNYFEGKDSCQGDSGGPLAQSYSDRYYVLGIVSYGVGCSGNGVYTRVNGYLDWIESVSGVRPAASDAGGATPSTPGATTYTGKLNRGQLVYAPNQNGFYHGGGVIEGRLSGASNTDFDLYLQQRTNRGWTTVSSSTGTTSDERINFRAGNGTYRWAVKAYRGEGAVKLVERR